MQKRILAVMAALALIGCTDAEVARLGSYGDAGVVKCYSGGTLIYEGTSTGKINTVQHSDGWEFKEAKSGKFIRVSGDCVIVN